jgi:hypothetical protein
LPGITRVCLKYTIRAVNQVSCGWLVAIKFSRSFQKAAGIRMAARRPKMRHPHNAIPDIGGS